MQAIKVLLKGLSIDQAEQEKQTLKLEYLWFLLLLQVVQNKEAKQGITAVGVGGGGRADYGHLKDPSR